MRHHAGGDNLYPNLADFFGPSLLVFNDAEFSESDFRSITRIGDSNKQAKRTKVGRFGVGFNSVYHLTDVPSFVSGNHIVWFDPHMRHLNQDRGAEPGACVCTCAYTVYCANPCADCHRHLPLRIVRLHFASAHAP